MTIRGDCDWKKSKEAKNLTNNMGVSTREQIEGFANGVLKDFPGSEFLWTTAGSMCSSKTIYLDELWIGDYPWAAKQMFLHEVAHFGTADDPAHGEIFHAEFARLVLKYMGQNDKGNGR